MVEYSPRVLDHGWGYVEVAGQGTFRDVKLWPGGGRGWDWRETGTDHRPGIQPGDVTELLEHQPDVVVLSRGRAGRLGVCPETLALLEGRGIATRCAGTAEAFEVYNTLVAEGSRVAGLFHTTC
jgi:hypothetical protein